MLLQPHSFDRSATNLLTTNLKAAEGSSCGDVQLSGDWDATLWSQLSNKNEGDTMAVVAEETQEGKQEEEDEDLKSLLTGIRTLDKCLHVGH